jgi:5-methylcytosine-specific restriction protein A
MNDGIRKAYLLTWNPKEFPWENLKEVARRVFEGQTVNDYWTTHSHKVRAGDRVFLIRLGKQPKGIMASGYAISEVEVRPDHRPERAEQGVMRHYIRLTYDHLLNPALDPLLSVTQLRTGPLRSVHWYSESSGIEIKAGIETLEQLWREHLANARPEIDDPDWGAIEGERRLELIRHRARERMLRDAKLDSHGRNYNGHLPCEVPGCGFDFLVAYGELGRDFAQVHHKKPLADLSSPTLTRLSDLAVVCPNCHAMIHRGGECRPMDTLIPRTHRGN